MLRWPGRPGRLQAKFLNERTINHQATLQTPAVSAKVYVLKHLNLKRVLSPQVWHTHHVLWSKPPNPATPSASCSEATAEPSHSHAKLTVFGMWGHTWSQACPNHISHSTSPGAQRKTHCKAHLSRVRIPKLLRLRLTL